MKQRYGWKQCQQLRNTLILVSLSSTQSKKKKIKAFKNCPLCVFAEWHAVCVLHSLMYSMLQNHLMMFFDAVQSNPLIRQMRERSQRTQDMAMH